MILTPPQPKKTFVNTLPSGRAGLLCTVRYAVSDGECLYWLNITMLLPCLFTGKDGSKMERDAVEKRVKKFAKERKTEYVDDMFLGQMMAHDKGSECMSLPKLDADNMELDIRVPFMARLEHGEIDPANDVLVLDYEFGNSLEYD
jgi:hypothetical protein